MPFDPFAAGQATEDAPESKSFDPFANGQATEDAPDKSFDPFASGQAEEHPDSIRQRLYAPGSTDLPTLDEAKILRRSSDGRTLGQKAAALPGAAVQGFTDTVGDLGTQLGAGDFREKQLGKEKEEGIGRQLKRAGLTAASGLAQGELGLADILRKGWRGLQLLGTGQPNQGGFYPAVPPGQDREAALDKIYHQKITEDLEMQRHMEQIRSGEESPLPWMFDAKKSTEQGIYNPELANAFSFIPSPASGAVIGRAAAAAKPLARTLQVLPDVGESFAQKAGQVAGRATQTVGKTVQSVAGAPAKAIEQLAEKLPSLGESGEKGTMASLISGAEEAGLPMGKLAVAKATGGAIEKVGQGLEHLAEGSLQSRSGIFEQLANNDAAPSWARVAAQKMRVLDSGVKTGAEIGKSAALGGAVNAALTLPGAESPEETAAAFGSGAALGTVTHLPLMMSGAKHQQHAAEDYDLARWFSRRTPEEQGALAGWDRERALTAATMESLANGLVSSKGAGEGTANTANVKATYLPGSVYQADPRFGRTRGVFLDTSEGQPHIYINADLANSRTLAHEFFHALEKSPDVVDTGRLTKELFPIMDHSDPANPKEVTPGLVSPAQYEQFADQYLSRLPADQKAALTVEKEAHPDVFKTRMRSEIAAELFANLVQDSPSNLLGDVNSTTRKALDWMLTGEQDSTLHKIGSKLESSLGRTPEAKSDIFRDLQNTPRISSMMREFVRQRDKLTKRMSFDENEAREGIFIPRSEFLKPGASKLMDLFGDSDMFAKDSKSTRADKVALSPNGQPILLSDADIKKVQARRADAMIKSLAAVPDAGVPGVMRLKGNGAWEGRQFSDAQLAALKALPDDILTPNIKARLEKLNEFLTDRGKPMLIHYNARLNSKGKYSSGIGETVRVGVPISMHISKAQNFHVNTLDLTAMANKRARWFRDKPKLLTDFQGPEDFTAKLYQYLGNHESGQPGMTTLNADPAVAKRMANRINDFLNMYDVSTEGANPDRASTMQTRDKLFRNRRVDAINKISESGADRTLLNHELVKQNFSPAPSPELDKINQERGIPATYLGFQEGIGRFPGFHMFNLTQDVPGVGVKDSTVAEKSLRAAGFNPDTPKAAGQFSPVAEEQPEKRFYSQLERVVEQKVQGKQIPAAQLAAIVRNPNSGIKADELKWSGLEDWLKGKGKVTKQEVQDYLAQNRVELKEVEKSGTVKSRASWDDVTGDEEKNRSFELHDPESGEKYASIQQNDDGIYELYRGDSGRRVGRFPTLDAAQDAGNEYLPDKSHGETDTKFETYQLPEGKNYRELLFTLPERAPSKPEPVPLTQLPTGYEFIHDSHQEPSHAWGVVTSEQTHARPVTGNWWPTQEDAVKDTLTYLNSVAGANHRASVRAETREANYNSSHWDEPNVLAHARVNERTDAQGKKVLFAEELQSDWHQQGRKKGYQGEGRGLPAGWEVKEYDGKWGIYDDSGDARVGGFDSKDSALLDFSTNPFFRDARGDIGRVPDAPFKNSWHELVFKRLLREAAEKGFDKLAWTTGEQQAERYDLSKQVDSIHYNHDKKNGTISFDVKKGGENVLRQENLSPEKAADYIGKEMVAKILSGQGKSKSQPFEANSYGVLKGVDLKVGGEGMKGFYDKILVDFANKFGKRWGTRVEDARLDEPSADYNIVDKNGGHIATWTFTSQAEAEAEIKSREAGYPRYQGAKAVKATDRPATTVHAFPITPEMRKSVVTEGLPLFSPSVQARVDKRQPIAKSIVDKGGVQLPSGYVLRGSLWVYPPQPVDAAPPVNG